MTKPSTDTPHQKRMKAQKAENIRLTKFVAEVAKNPKPAVMYVEPTLITIRPLAARLSCSVHAIYKWVRNNKFPKPLKPNGPMGHAYWRIADVEDFEAGKWKSGA